MNLYKYERLVFSLAIGGLLLLGLFTLLHGTSQIARADPGLLFVKPDGAGTDCTQVQPCALPAGLSQATAGDTIYVATGVYTGSGAAVITITQSITLYGGWDGATTTPPLRDPVLYPSTLDGENARRGVHISGDITSTLDGFIITGGDATGLGGDHWGWDAGGGLYVRYAVATISSNWVFSNTAQRGGGLYLYASPATLSGNTIISNTADKSAGGLFLYSSDTTLGGNTVISNTTGGDGGGLHLASSDATLSGNTFTSNAAGNHGGGLYVHGSNATLSDNFIAHNTANRRGGGLYLGSSNATLDRNAVISNTANWSGGGMFMYFSDAMLTNNVVADNRATRIVPGPAASTGGSGLYVWASSPRLLHTTIAHNTGGDGSGVYVTEFIGPFTEYSTVAMTNTILVSHTVGITVTAGNTATLEATLWGSGAWANTTDWAGDGTILTGTVNVRGAPAFVDPDGGDYHITGASAARDAGVDAGVTTDIDGDPRPNGLYDIGADEFYCYALTGVDIAGAATGIVDTAYTFTATVAPLTANLPITYTWSPQPDAGQGSAIVAYTWTTTGVKAITVTAENCGGVVSNTRTIAIAAPPWWYVYLPLVIKN